MQLIGDQDGAHSSNVDPSRYPRMPRPCVDLRFEKPRELAPGAAAATHDAALQSLNVKVFYVNITYTFCTLSLHSHSTRRHEN